MAVLAGALVALIAIADTRARVAAAVEALAVPGPWRESRWSWDLFPADPSVYAHLSFAVGVPTTRFAAAGESVRHKRGADGGLVESDLSVRWTYRMRADRQVGDYDAALGAEAALIVALGGVPLTDMHLWIVEMRRELTGDGAWMLGDVRCIVRHRIAVQ